MPPLEQQRRILAELETRVSRIEAGEQYLRAVIQKIRFFRNSVLQAAIEGRLVKAEDIGSATDELIQAGVSPECLSEDGAPPGWTLCRIGDLARVGSGATPKRGNPRYWTGGEIPWVTSGQLAEPYVRSAREFITRRALTETSVKLWPAHTLLVAMYGEGRTRGLCSELLIEATTNQACAAIVLPDSLSTLRPWVKLFLTASYERNRRLASGGVQPNLSLGLIKELVVPVPPTRLRDMTMKEVDRLTSLADAAERASVANLRRSNALRTSLVEAGVTGALTAQTGTSSSTSKGSYA